MNTPISTMPADRSYLNVALSEKGLSEFRNSRRVVFIPKDQIPNIELKIGSHAEKPLLQTVLGILLLGLGLEGVRLFLAENARAFTWGSGFIFFGIIGVYCLFEAWRKGPYLQVTCPRDNRKLVFTGLFKKEECFLFLKNASALGYTVDACKNGDSI